jgi:hypothetical protein
MSNNDTSLKIRKKRWCRGMIVGFLNTRCTWTGIKLHDAFTAN